MTDGIPDHARPALVRRFSSRIQRLDHVFLQERLRNARQYDRIAGYFRSSIFEVAAEELLSVGRVRVVCNSDLNPEDLRASKEARASAMLQRWWAEGAEGSVELDTLLRSDRYGRLKQMLSGRDANGKPRVEIKVIDRVVAPLLHGKAGVITLADGRKTCFMGSVNETRHAWQDHYELLWEDESDEGVAWTQAEFDFLWKNAVDLPDAIIDEVTRCADRVEIHIEDCPAWSLGGKTDLPRAALAESPLARAGEGLQPWQKAFVAEFLRHREVYGQARLLLADEVGVGKTLSLATAALLTALMGDGPALILVPSTLTQQWQVELWDRLGVPSARWWSARKVWVDHLGHVIRTNGAAGIVKCPFKVAVVSTGLMMKMSEERDCLLRKRAMKGGYAYGVVVLDEAHRARGSTEAGTEDRKANNLLSFMLEIAPRTKHLLLGTATPIQTDPLDLWDLMQILGRGADHVLGNHMGPWRNGVARSLDLVTGRERPRQDSDAWPWLSNPLPPGKEHFLFDHVRSHFDLPDGAFVTAESYTALDAMTREELQDLLVEDPDGLGFLQTNNPVVRHVVLRRRKTLEEAGLMKPVAVEIHPRPNEPDYRSRLFFGPLGRAVETSATLREAFEEADKFTKALMSRNKGAGFMSSFLLQRICSSTRAGLSTAKILGNPKPEEQEALLDALDGEEASEMFLPVRQPSDGERAALKRLTELLEAAVAEGEDPKYHVVRHYLRERQWLELGCIVFSQYFDTAEWAAKGLASDFPGEPIALYAGAGKSGVFREGRFNAVEREAIKLAVRDRAVRLVIATDAACEGLNLQALGTLINVDLPWNPSRLEQRIGRIKRFGQMRDSVDMLNLVYEGSRDEAIYEKLSERMKDKFDIFGQLPDTLSDDWIDDEQGLDRELKKFVEGRQRANAFDARWGNTATGISMSAAEREWQRGWQTCTEVLSRRDVQKVMQEGW